MSEYDADLEIGNAYADLRRLLDLERKRTDEQIQELREEIRQLGEAVASALISGGTLG